jgi:hypothetical protein
MIVDRLKVEMAGINRETKDCEEEHQIQIYNMGIPQQYLQQQGQGAGGRLGWELPLLLTILPVHLRLVRLGRLVKTLYLHLSMCPPSLQQKGTIRLLSKPAHNLLDSS